MYEPRFGFQLKPKWLQAANLSHDVRCLSQTTEEERAWQSSCAENEACSILCLTLQKAPHQFSSSVHQEEEASSETWVKQSQTSNYYVFQTPQLGQPAS